MFQLLWKANFNLPQHEEDHHKALNKAEVQIYEFLKRKINKMLENCSRCCVILGPFVFIRLQRSSVSFNLKIYRTIDNGFSWWRGKFSSPFHECIISVGHKLVFGFADKNDKRR